MDLSDLPEEPLARIRFAVLLHGPVGVSYCFWRQGDYLAQLRMDHCRLHDLMGELEYFTPFLLYLMPHTGRTGDMVGTEVLAAIDDTEIVLPEYPVLLKILASLQQTEEGGKEGFKIRRVNLVHDGPHLRVGGNRLDVPQVRKIRGKRGSLGALLERKQ